MNSSLNCTILALVRPRLNLAQPFNQVSHLIEHALLSPRRQTSIGLSDKLFGTKILNSNGWTSELYMVEYYIVQSKVAEKIKKILIKNQNYLELSKNEKEYIAMRAVLIEELKEKKLSIMSIAEQFERAIYQKNSPALAQLWFDPTAIENISAEDTQKIFNSHHLPTYLIELSFNAYNGPVLIPTKHNRLITGKKTIHLRHPHQPIHSSLVNILIPYTLDKTGYVTFLLYRQLLSHYRSGLLIKELRYKFGLIYGLSLFYNQYARAIQFSYECSSGKELESIKKIEEIIQNASFGDSAQLAHMKEVVTTGLELDWNNIHEYALHYINEIVLSGLTTPTKTRIEQTREVNGDDLFKLNHQVIKALHTKGITVILQHGQDVATL